MKKEAFLGLFPHVTKYKNSLNNSIYIFSPLSPPTSPKLRNQYNRHLLQSEISLATAMSKCRQALNYLEILREAIKLPLITWKLVLAIAFFILVPSYLAALAAISLNLPPLFVIKKHNGTTVEVELVREVLYWLATTLVASALSKAYIEKPSSILQLFSSLARQWRKIFVTSILTQLIMLITWSSMLLVLGNPRTAAWLRCTTTIIVISLFLFVHLACQLSILIASIEESSNGLTAIQKASEYELFVCNWNS